MNFQSPAAFNTLKFNSYAAAESTWLSDMGGKGRTYFLLTEQSYACYVTLKGTLWGEKKVSKLERKCAYEYQSLATSHRSTNSLKTIAKRAIPGELFCHSSSA